eukprot:3493008-Rhodomonas_salina.1
MTDEANTYRSGILHLSGECLSRDAGVKWTGVALRAVPATAFCRLDDQHVTVFGFPFPISSPSLEMVRSLHRTACGKCSAIALLIETLVLLRGGLCVIGISSPNLREFSPDVSRTFRHCCCPKCLWSTVVSKASPVHCPSPGQKSLGKAILIECPIRN